MPAAPLRPAVFLDRDGVVIANRDDYVRSVADVDFIPGALAALARLAASPVSIVIATNQSAIGRGLVAAAAVDAINRHVVSQVAAAGGRVDAVYVCPHLPWAGCACRKPAPGLLLQAAATLHLDLAASTIIGDSLADVLAGHAAGAQAVLVRTGRGEREALELARALPEHPALAQVPVLADLPAAVAHLAATQLWFTNTPPVEGGQHTAAQILP